MESVLYAGTQVQPSKTAAQHLPKRRRVRTVLNNNKSINKARIRRILAQPNGLKQLHQRELPPEPERHEDLDDHALGECITVTLLCGTFLLPLHFATVAVSAFLRGQPRNDEWKAFGLV